MDTVGPCKVRFSCLGSNRKVNIWDLKCVLYREVLIRSVLYWRLYCSYTESVAHTHVGLCLVQVTEVAGGRSPPSELYSGTVSTDNHSTIDEVEGTALYVVCDLETSLNKLLIRSTVGGHYSQSVECRTQSREHHMTTGACNAMVVHGKTVFTIGGWSVDLIWTPLRWKKVSLLERCPLLRG